MSKLFHNTFAKHNYYDAPLDLDPASLLDTEEGRIHLAQRIAPILRVYEYDMI